MKHLLSIIAFLCSTYLYSQAPNIDWEKQYGGNLGDYFRAVIPTADGGFLMGGWSNSPVSGIKSEAMIGFNYDYWIVKTSSTGVVEWQKTLGGGRTWGLGDEAGEILNILAEANDGSGYFLCGYSDSGAIGMKTESSYGGFDFWIVKIDLLGNIIWQKTIGGSNNDILLAAKSTADGGCIVGGSSESGISGNKSESSRGSSDYWVVKLSASGIIEWQKTIGGNGIDDLYGIVPSTDGYLIAGYSSSSVSGDKTEINKGYGDFWILKLGLTGNLIWQKDIGSTGGDLLYSAIKTTSGYLLGGESTSNAAFDKTENSRGGSDFWIVSIDNFGNVLWDKTYGGSDNDILLELSTTLNNGFILAGESYSTLSGDKTTNVYGDSDGWVIKTDNNGALLWQLDIGGLDSDGFNEVVSLEDGSYLLGGMSAQGSFNTGNITANSYGGYDYLLVKLLPEELDSIKYNENTFCIYPNPTSENINLDFFNSFESFEVTTYNEMMQMLDKKSFINTISTSIDMSYPVGIYFLKVKTANREWIKKVLKK